MKSNLRSLSLSTQLVLAFVLIVVASGALVATMIISNRKVRASYDGLLGLELDFQDHAQNIYIHALNARRREKDFLLRQDVSYVGQARAEVAKVVAEAQGMKDLEERRGDKDSYGAKILDSIRRYEGAFVEVSDAWVAKGLDENSGNQGKFRAAAHGLEAAIEGKQALMVGYLMLRRHEKDYILRMDAKYVDQADKQIEMLRSSMRSSQLSAKLEIYQSEFHQLVESDKVIAEKTEIMRQAAQEVEPLVESAVKTAETGAAERQKEIAAAMSRNTSAHHRHQPGNSSSRRSGIPDNRPRYSAAGGRRAYGDRRAGSQSGRRGPDCGPGVKPEEARHRDSHGDSRNGWEAQFGHA